MKVVVLLDRNGVDVPVQVHPKYGIVGCGGVETLFRTELELVHAVLQAIQPYKDSFPKPPELDT